MAILDPKLDNIDILVFKNIFDIERMTEICSKNTLTECMNTLTTLVACLDYTQYTLLLQNMEEYVKYYIPNGWREPIKSVYGVTITYQEFIYILFTDDLTKTKRGYAQIEAITTWLKINNFNLKVNDFICPWCEEGRMVLSKRNLFGKYHAKCEFAEKNDCADIVDPETIPNVIVQLIEYPCRRI